MYFVYEAFEELQPGSDKKALEMDLGPDNMAVLYRACDECLVNADVNGAVRARR